MWCRIYSIFKFLRTIKSFSWLSNILIVEERYSDWLVPLSFLPFFPFFFASIISFLKSTCGCFPYLVLEMHSFLKVKMCYAVMANLSETDKQIKGAAQVIVLFFLIMRSLQGALAPCFPFKKEVRFFTGGNAFTTLDLLEIYVEIPWFSISQRYVFPLPVFISSSCFTFVLLFVRQYIFLTLTPFLSDIHSSLSLKRGNLGKKTRKGT